MGVAYFCRDCGADMTEFMPEEIDRLTAENAALRELLNQAWGLLEKLHEPGAGCDCDLCTGMFNLLAAIDDVKEE